MLVTIRNGGISCWSDLYRVDSGVVVISLFGPRNSVRAIWARMSAKRSYEQIDTDVGLTGISLNSERSYVTMQTPLSRGDLHLVVLDLQATNQGSFFKDHFYLVGDDAPETFFNKLNSRCRVPFRAEWAGYLWAQANERGDIYALRGYGAEAYYVPTDTDTWSEIVKAGIESGEIT